MAACYDRQHYNLFMDGKQVGDYVPSNEDVSQKGGTFHLNGKPAMLSAAQIMGFRGRIENMITWLRCPPDWWVAKEMMP